MYHAGSDFLPAARFTCNQHPTFSVSNKLYLSSQLLHALAISNQLIEWLRGDGYTDVLDGDGWRVYPPDERPTVDPNPDHGLLMQEARDVSGDFPPGYAPISLPQPRDPNAPKQPGL